MVAIFSLRFYIFLFAAPFRKRRNTLRHRPSFVHRYFVFLFQIRCQKLLTCRHYVAGCYIGCYIVFVLACNNPKVRVPKHSKVRRRFCSKDLTFSFFSFCFFVVCAWRTYCFISGINSTSFTTNSSVVLRKHLALVVPARVHFLFEFLDAEGRGVDDDAPRAVQVFQLKREFTFPSSYV